MPVDITPRPSESPESAHSNPSPVSERRLRIYLSDHRAGAEAARARAKRFAAANETGFVGDAANEVYREIEADVRTLDEILDRLGCRPSRWKMTVVQQRQSELSGFDFDDLQRRAMQQRMQLESHRAPTVNEAFVP
jgi:hypothetical protein